jgi:hypothetical protein
MTSLRKLSFAALAALSLVAAACGEGAKLNEACTKTGSTEECAENLICDTDKNATVICLQKCASDADCNTATHSCTGTSGSNQKACHTK